MLPLSVSVVPVEQIPAQISLDPLATLPVSAVSLHSVVGREAVHVLTQQASETADCNRADLQLQQPVEVAAEAVAVEAAVVVRVGLAEMALVPQLVLQVLVHQ